VRNDEVLHQDERLRGTDGNEARKVCGQLDAGKALFTRSRVTNRYCEVEREVRDVRKRMCGIDRERREDRIDPLHELFSEFSLFDRRKLVPPFDEYSLLDELGAQRIAPDLLLCARKFLCSLPDFGELLCRRAPVGSGRHDVAGDLVLQSRHSNLVELVEVRTEDRNEPTSLEQGNVRFRCQ